MKREAIEPVVTVNKDGHEVYRHPAYGMMSFSIHTGRSKDLFASDIEHHQTVSIRLYSAVLDRNLSSDWIHTEKPLFEVEMSQMQFANFVSNSERGGGGTPCTIRTLPETPYPLQEVPTIKKPETKAEIFKREFKLVEQKLLETLTGRCPVLKNL